MPIPPCDKFYPGETLVFYKSLSTTVDYCWPHDVAFRSLIMKISWTRIIVPREKSDMKVCLTFGGFSFSSFV